MYSVDSSTSTTRSPREWIGGFCTLQAFAADNTIGYLDGAIITYPARIGDDSTVLVYSGARDAYDNHVDTLRALGGVLSGS